MDIFFEISDLDLIIHQITDEVAKETSKKLEKLSQFARNNIYQNISFHRDFRGNRLADNKLSTIRQKGFNFPLVRTGDMARSIKYFKINNNHYEVKFTDKLSIYSRFLHKLRPVVGISQEILSEAERIFNG